MKKLVFNRIKFDDRFPEEFQNLTKNNEIDWKKGCEKKNMKEFCILYGPNGVGKSSLSQVLGGKENSELDCDYYNDATESIKINQNNVKDYFSIIKDQNNRNIIQGDASSFFIGKNIRRETELHEKNKKFIDSTLYKSLKDELKNFGITIKTSSFFYTTKKDKYEYFFSFIQDSFSTKHNLEMELLKDITSFLEMDIEPSEIEEIQKSFFINNLKNKKESFLNIYKNIQTSDNDFSNIFNLTLQKDADKLLHRMKGNECIVCNTQNIDVEALKKQKQILISTMEKSLQANDKALMEYKEYLEKNEDPFGIIDSLDNYSGQEQFIKISEVQDKINNEETKFIEYVIYNIHNKILEFSRDFKDLQEYWTIIKEELKIKDDDIDLVESLFSNYLHKNFSIVREKTNHRLELKVGTSDLLGKERAELPLSSGEQNFISLIFEMLRVKNQSNSSIIVFDDPISSFDSIYKNKIAFFIIQLMYEKNCILLTHNLDLVKLINFQHIGCYNLYLFQKSGEFGFINVENQELENVLSIVKFNEFLRSTENSKNIKNKKMFALSLIPYIRGYAHICGNDEVFKGLSTLMHGYTNNSIIDIRSLIVNLINIPIFSDDNLEFPTTSGEIIEEIEKYTNNNDSIGALPDIIDNYPLLNKTLKHSLYYFYLRLKTEKILFTHFCLELQDGKIHTLTDIIMLACSKVEKDKKNKFKSSLLSKKTLLNEFNHFEGNLNIFQPAIDISDKDLISEKRQIIDFLNKIDLFEIK